MPSRASCRAPHRAAPRTEEVPQARPLPGFVVDAVTRNVGQPDIAAAPELRSCPRLRRNRHQLVVVLKGIAGRLLPSRDLLPVPDQGAVRTSMPVGELQYRAMDLARGISFADCRCRRNAVAARRRKALTRKAAAKSLARTAEIAPAEPTPNVRTATGPTTVCPPITESIPTTVCSGERGRVSGQSPGESRSHSQNRHRPT